MIILSAETRWFGTERIPEGLDAFFRTDASLVRSEDPREDVYLDPNPGWPQVGVKLREGRLEAKTLVATGHDLESPGGIAARVAGWSKWSLEPDLGERQDALTAAYERSAPTAVVVKARRLRKFAPVSGDVVAGRDTNMVGVDPSASSDRGCAVEISRLTGHRNGTDPIESWTFGFEAVGRDLEESFALLSATAVRVLADLDAATLRVLRHAECLSYPAWLSTGPRR